MLRPEDKRAIEDLFERLTNVEKHSGARDFDAEKLIWENLRRHPEAAYYMAQTIIVQEAALREQQSRIEALEDDVGNGAGGFLESIFGDDRPKRLPVQREAARGPAREGGFLAGAAETALGVTGGILLGNAIGGMFGGSAKASESGDEIADDGGEDWGGGFDIGGDF